MSFGGDCGQPSYSERCKEMGKALRASVLVLLLTCSVQAGWIHNGVTEPPPPAPAVAEQEPTANGDIQNDLTETVLSVLGSVLALF
jgi:hypothetical protein